jgi:membrane-associated phospholipid phosphatase
MVYALAHGVADAVAPLLALLALLNPVIRPPLGDRRAVRRYLVATALGVAGIYLVAALDFALGLWSRAGLDYSTHTAFATTLAISLWRSRPGWVWALGAVLLVNALLILALGFHSLGDVVTSTIVAAAVALIQHPKNRRRYWI